MHTKYMLNIKLLYSLVVLSGLYIYLHKILYPPCKLIRMWRSAFCRLGDSKNYTFSKMFFTEKETGFCFYSYLTVFLKFMEMNSYVENCLKLINYNFTWVDSPCKLYFLKKWRFCCVCMYVLALKRTSN